VDQVFNMVEPDLLHQTHIKLVELVEQAEHIKLVELVEQAEHIKSVELQEEQQFPLIKLPVAASTKVALALESTKQDLDQTQAFIKLDLTQEFIKVEVEFTKQEAHQELIKLETQAPIKVELQELIKAEVQEPTKAELEDINHPLATKAAPTNPINQVTATIKVEPTNLEQAVSQVKQLQELQAQQANTVQLTAIKRNEIK